MRKKLRDPYNREQLAGLYPTPHRHDVFPDHIERVKTTIEFAVEHAGPYVQREPFMYFVADLSTGDAAIPRGILEAFPPSKVSLILGDIADGYELTGTIGETLPHMAPNSVHLFVCCETLEHVADPDAMLREIRFHADTLLMSTPVDNLDDDNPEHLWGWQRQDVEDMLTAAGWKVEAFRDLDLRPKGFPYRWGMWYAS